jgi:hypothetical protein
MVDHLYVQSIFRLHVVTIMVTSFLLERLDSAIYPFSHRMWAVTKYSTMFFGDRSFSIIQTSDADICLLRGGLPMLPIQMPVKSRCLNSQKIL